MRHGRDARRGRRLRGRARDPVPGLRLSVVGVVRQRDPAAPDRLRPRLCRRRRTRLRPSCELRSHGWRSWSSRLRVHVWSSARNCVSCTKWLRPSTPRSGSICDLRRRARHETPAHRHRAAVPAARRRAEVLRDGDHLATFSRAAHALLSRRSPRRPDARRGHARGRVLARAEHDARPVGAAGAALLEFSSKPRVVNLKPQ